MPFMLNTEYLINNKYSASATILINKFQSGKIVNGLTIQSGDEPSYFAVDFAAKLFFRRVLDKHTFTPYVTAGPGYYSIAAYQAKNKSDILVSVPKTQDITLNAGLGAYYWINRSWGLNFSYMAKFGLKLSDTGNINSNQLVSSFGVFYRFDTTY